MTKFNLFRCAVMVAAAVVLSTGSFAYAGTTIYKYDAHGRTVEIDYPDGSVIKYVYDSAGNRIQVTR